jgi:L-lactate dehydrogenase complex protein LldG
MNSTKEFILDSIRNTGQKDSYSYPEIPDFTKSKRPILDEFKENLELAAGTWHDVDDKNSIADLMKSLHPDAKIICSAAPDILGNKDLNKISDPHDLADVDVGIIRAQFGVAETGMLWVTDDDLVINALGFLSQHIIVLLDSDMIVRDMHEAYSKIHLEKNNYGCFVLGPSATADIGAVMVRGAQGPRSLSVFFM